MYAGQCRGHGYHSEHAAAKSGVAGDRVDELRKDPTRGHWILIRPKAKPARQTDCPYCPGAEHLTGPEITAFRPEGSAPNSPGWTVRVVPEPDAYFRIEWELVREGVGMFDMINPRGASELVVESPRHDDTLASMGPTALESVLWMYRDRLIDLKRDGQIRDILISRRHKKPGVAPHHPYSRVTAIPIVFDETRRELREAREYYQYKRLCLYFHMLRQEIGEGDWDTMRDDYHWHVEVVAEPERANRVGGIFVNEKAPELFAAELRDAWPTADEREWTGAPRKTDRRLTRRWGCGHRARIRSA